MKTMTCRQLGGACDQKFTAQTFEEITKLSKKHGMEMHRQGDRAHREAMSEMQKHMGSSDSLANWMESKRLEFENLPDEK